jgi:hypothetical protein
MIEIFWLPSNYDGVLDGDQNILVTILHTHIIGWQSKFFSPLRKKVGDEKKIPKR